MNNDHEKIFDFMVKVKYRLLLNMPDVDISFEPQDRHSLYIRVKWTHARLEQVVSINEIITADFDCAGKWVERIKKRIAEPSS
jgi:hypothetical protein